MASIEVKAVPNPYHARKVAVNVTKGCGAIQLGTDIFPFKASTILCDFIAMMDEQCRGITDLEGQTIEGNAHLWSLSSICLWYKRQLYEISFTTVEKLPWHNRYRALNAIFVSAPSHDPANDQFRSPTELKTWLDKIKGYEYRCALSRPNRNRMLIACKYIKLCSFTFAAECKCPHNISTSKYLEDLKRLIRVLRKEPSIKETNTPNRRDNVIYVLEHGYELCDEAYKRLGAS